MRTAIIITCYNRLEYLEKCFNSLLNTFLPKDLLIYIIDDCSTDKKTIDLIRSFNHSCKIQKIYKKKNKGIYHSLITAYDYCFKNYDNIILVPEDAIVNNYFYDMLLYYKNLFPNNIVSGFNTLTLSELGSPRHPIAYNGEWYLKKMTSGSIGNLIDKNLYLKYIRPTLIEQAKKKKYCYDTISAKKAYNDDCGIVCTVPSTIEHVGINSSTGHSFNPDVAIDFKEYIEINTIQKFKCDDKKMITVNIATYPPRKQFLEQVIKNLLSIDIIDKIRVYLNEYDKVPLFLINNKIEYIIGKENLKDSGKFYWAGTNKNEYYFTCDDDLEYNKEYFEKHIELLEEHNGEIFVSLHGKVLRKKPKTFRDFSVGYHWKESLEENKLINFPGTGVMVFDNSKHSIPIEMFKYHGMADLWIAYYCQKYNIPCAIRKHDKNELTLLYKGSDTLWNKQNEIKKQHQKILELVPKWELVPTKIDICYIPENLTKEEEKLKKQRYNLKKERGVVDVKKYHSRQKLRVHINLLVEKIKKK